jgi:hypothetical protein
MKIGVLKLGKKDGVSESTEKTKKLTVLEEQLNDRTHNLKQTEAKLKKMSGDPILEPDPTVKPHGPVAELSLEEIAEADAAAADATAVDDLAVPDAPPAVIVSDGIKLVQYHAGNPAPPPETSSSPLKTVSTSAPPAKPAESAPKDTKSTSTNDMSALFAHEDEEENPLASLIKSMVDVPANELMDDVKEIKDIIKDWQKK